MWGHYAIHNIMQKHADATHVLTYHFGWWEWVGWNDSRSYSVSPYRVESSPNEPKYAVDARQHTCWPQLYIYKSRTTHRFVLRLLRICQNLRDSELIIQHVRIWIEDKPNPEHYACVSGPSAPPPSKSETLLLSLRIWLTKTSAIWLSHPHIYIYIYTFKRPRTQCVVNWFWYAQQGFNNPSQLNWN